MTRTWMLALPAAVALVFAACGGDSNDDTDADATATEAVTGSPVVSDGLGQPKSQATLPPPTAVADDEITLAVVFGSNSFSPTVAEFRDLPKTEVTAAGQKQSGVTIGVLAEKVGANGASVVTISGLRKDLKQEANTRYQLADIASTTIVALDDEGHVNLYSSSIPEGEWLKVLAGVSFTQ
ncbi:MAG: hypothetical protein IT303_18360 [Dehalococcoidia bacterium]|nr:hypothetical protein [Dehalococcoidia bacterium]